MTRFPEQELLAYAASDPVKERAAILRQAVESHNELRERTLIAETALRQFQKGGKWFGVLDVNAIPHIMPTYDSGSPSGSATE